jgi:hypothetical protein
MAVAETGTGDMERRSQTRREVEWEGTGLESLFHDAVSGKYGDL